MSRSNEIVMGRLGELAQIKSGASIRGKIEIDPEGETFLIQQGDINLNGISGELKRIHHLKIDRDRLQNGDVLLRSKGTPTVAAEFIKTGGLPIVAAPAVLILRLGQDSMLPAFLTWIINSEWGQKVLTGRRTGRHIPVIPRKALEDIVIPVPSLDEQRAICELSTLAKRHEQLASQYREKIDSLLVAKSMGAAFDE